MIDRSEGNPLVNQLDRTRRLKSGGVGAYDGALGASMADLLGRLSGHGLFLVPKGELEQRLADYSVGVSVSDKRAWANAAAQRVQSVGRQDGDVWDFVALVARVGKVLTA